MNKYIATSSYIKSSDQIHTSAFNSITYIIVHMHTHAQRSTATDRCDNNLPVSHYITESEYTKSAFYAPTATQGGIVGHYLFYYSSISLLTLQ